MAARRPHRRRARELRLEARHHRAGYNVVVTGVDGFSATYTSAEVATLKNKLVVANRVNGVPLALGTASIKNPMTPEEYATWKPNWPLKLVSSDPGIFGSRKPAAIARISIVPAEAGERAADTGVPYGWLRCSSAASRRAAR